MAFIKEESEDMNIEETFRVKQEETEEQTDLMQLKEDNEGLNEREETDQNEKHCDFINGDKSLSCSGIEKAYPRKRGQKTETRSNVKCQQCGKSFVKHGYINIHVRIHTGEKP
ncbi:gastrula zinc finger protein XlCGF8.2DB-like [Pimephales promelas]|nr:gastrula zinc finger protein XlCGF8.2DB-like [Pimephales promelas]